MSDWMTGTYKEDDISAWRNIFLTKYALRALSHVINIGVVHVIITIVSAKQVYNGKVKLFNDILFVSPFSILLQLLVMS